MQQFYIVPIRKRVVWEVQAESCLSPNKRRNDHIHRPSFISSLQRNTLNSVGFFVLLALLYRDFWNAGILDEIWNSCAMGKARIRPVPCPSNMWWQFLQMCHGQYLRTVQHKPSTLNNACLNIVTTPKFVFNNFQQVFIFPWKILFF